jgi:hypothetical protein
LEKKTKKLVDQVEEKAVGAHTPAFYAARIHQFLNPFLQIYILNFKTLIHSLQKPNHSVF